MTSLSPTYDINLRDDYDNLIQNTNLENDISADGGIHRDGKKSKIKFLTADEKVEIEVLEPLTNANTQTRPEQNKSSRCNDMKCGCFQICLREHHPAASSNTVKGHVLDAILCPPRGKCAKTFVLILTGFLIWGVTWSITGNDALPGGFLFALIMLGIAAEFGGRIAGLVRLPPLIGMLLAGFMLRNIPKINIATDLNSEWSSTFRTIALAVILTRAGLGLDPQALRKLSFVCVRLAFLPCLVETATLAVVSHFLLNFPWLWGFMLGFVIAAVSPAVIVPCMLQLQDKRLGTNKGIPTLVIAAASVDDVLAIAGFGIVLGITFSTGNLVMTILHGPIEVLIGLAYGGIVGIVLWFLPDHEMETGNFYRVVLLFGLGLFALFGSRASGYAGAGALACLILAFVAAHGWRKRCNESLEQVARYFAHFWTFFQPFLFGLIGAELNIDNLKSDAIALGIGTLAIGLTVRIAVSAVVVCGGGFTLKEHLFIALAWLPKATVQAAIGPVALDFVRKNNLGENSEMLGIQVLTLAVLAILLTAPLGAAAITISAPFLLSQNGDVSGKGLERPNNEDSEDPVPKVDNNHVNSTDNHIDMPANDTNM